MSRSFDDQMWLPGPHRIASEPGDCGRRLTVICWRRHQTVVTRCQEHSPSNGFMTRSVKRRGGVSAKRFTKPDCHLTLHLVSSYSLNSDHLRRRRMDDFLPYRPSVCRRCGSTSRPLESVIVGTAPNISAVWMCRDCKNATTSRGGKGLWILLRDRLRRFGKA